ncbi:MAG TPA: MBL fold metallo-hydrolase [Gaiellaceae bacterium]
MSGATQPLSITWLGHGTVLLESSGTRLLTDPLLRPWLGHVRRVAPPAEVPPEVDAVLISHAHHDHFDFRSLGLVRARQFVVPRGLRGLLERRGLGPVVELDEGGELSVGPVGVRATHAAHGGRRGLLFTPIAALGYLISTPARVYYAGDTGPFEEMRELAPGLDVALLPIWGWGPRLGPGHLDPRQAAEALRLLAPRLAIPVHWGTYSRIGMPRDEASLREPALRFERFAAELAPDVEVRVLAPGERLELPLSAPAGGTP